MWVTVLASKDRAVETIREFKQKAEVESGCRLMTLCMDRGAKFNSTEFARHCAKEGVHSQLTAPYSPQQNGVIERRNAMVVGVARSMLKAKGLPDWFWGEEVITAVYLLNRVPYKANGGRTPFELWHGKTPVVHHLKVFGCIMYVKNMEPHLKKLDDRGQKMIFVGYERGSKAYWAYDPVFGRLMVTRDVVFDKSGSWDWPGEGEGNVEEAGQDCSLFSVEYRGVQVPEIEAVEPEDGQGSSSDSSAELSEVENPGSFSPVAEIVGHNSPLTVVHHMNPLFEPDEAKILDVDCEDVPLRF
jgi:hypothetical protein